MVQGSKGKGGDKMLQLTALSQAEVEAVHQATLRILSEAGIALGQAEARDLLVGAGAKVQGDQKGCRNERFSQFDLSASVICLLTSGLCNLSAAI